MKPSVTLLMAMHCHQPVGNFGFVFEDAYAKAYDPFVRVVERHPDVRLALHYSGCLLDWLADHRPEFLARVHALVKRGQVELLASGYYEPILPMIPEVDRQGQIAQMRSTLRRRFGADAQGLWLTERVWEPELPETLARAGIRYTMVDTNQFGLAKPWLPSASQVQDEHFWDVLGSYATDYAGSSVIVFPASKRLRYWMPFQSVERTIEFLKQLQRDEPVAITFADDGEKFGMWPKTYHWVYEEGWLDRFFSALEQERAWLRAETFHHYLEGAQPNGRVYLPCGSYEEMLEWSGGQFRNFFTKYPEANAMQQKMLRISRTLSQLRAERGTLKVAEGKARASRRTPLMKREGLLQQAQQELYTAQCNCAYWHGVFGGLYLSHLRRAVYAHLIAAEQLTAQAMGVRETVVMDDVDGDGCEEASLTTSTMGVVVDPSDGGVLTEWSLSGPRLNLLDTLTRRHEPYHDKLRSQQAASVASSGGSPASIHDALGVKEDDLASHLIYDDHRRSAFLDYAFGRMPTLQEVVRSTWGEQRLWSSGPWQWEARASKGRGRWLDVGMVRTLSGGRLRKTVRIATDQPLLECRYETQDLTIPVVGLEFNLSLRDERYLTTPQERVGATQFVLQEASSNVSLTLSLDAPATIIHFPIETVSESEEGLERTYQGMCVVCLWTVKAPRWHVTTQWTVTVS